MDHRNNFYTDIAIINQCFCKCQYVLEIDHTSEKVRTVLSNHVSSLLAQQNHMVHLRNDTKIASRVINPRRACSNNSLRSDMALIFLRPEGSQMVRSAQFFMNIKRGRKRINHGVAYKGSSLSLIIENQQIFYNEWQWTSFIGNPVVDSLLQMISKHGVFWSGYTLLYSEYGNSERV